MLANTITYILNKFYSTQKYVLRLSSSKNMSNTTIRPIPTLKGIFSVPRVTQGRNFLKENKQSLRSLEKATTKKIAAKEPVRPKWMPPLRRTASEANEHESKRTEPEKSSSSRHHEPDTCLLQQQQSNMPEPNIHYGKNTVLEQRGQLTEKQSRKANQVEQETTSERCQSCGTTRSCTSIGIQTDEIMDEIYLTNALKRCNFDNKTILSEGRNLCIDTGVDYDDNYDDYSQYNNEDEPLSARSKRSQFNIDDNETMPMPGLHNLQVDNTDEEAPLSARSRETIATVASNATTKSKRREHKLGSRDDLRLPRYLEKEKRDKAEAKDRIESRDPDCPRGHVLLSEKDRVIALANAKKRFDTLISELNHMPMTATTLRIRSRKAEIEKELQSAEDEIRIYSKEKVFVKASKSRNL